MAENIRIRIFKSGVGLDVKVFKLTSSEFDDYMNTTVWPQLQNGTIDFVKIEEWIYPLKP